MSTYVQIEVERNKSHRICWVEDEDKVRVGNSIRFKNEEKFYNIIAVYGNQSKGNINRSWHVGGL
jgi:hypothetical protein